ncbi:MAG: DMT family transporter [Clostridia bacterium]|nr:DMT family transporter [Clostridia bacterium]
MIQKKGNSLFGYFMLFVAALFWGTTFVAQSIGADYVPAFTYLAGRSWIAVVFLTPVQMFFDRYYAKKGIDHRPKTDSEKKLLIMGGIISGVMLCAASATQQIGMAYTSASKAGFITAQYVVLVPIISAFQGKAPKIHVWFCVLITSVGMYFLCMQQGSFSIEKGDAWVVLSAVLYAIEIMILYYFAPRVDGIRLSRLQFLVIAIISTVVMVVYEKPSIESIRLGIWAIAYAGVFSSGIAYTAQIIGQRDTNETIGSMVMSLESVFSAVSGWIVLHERMSSREMFGAVLMFASILLAQIDFTEMVKKAIKRK